MPITLRGRDHLILATKIDNAILFRGDRILFRPMGLGQAKGHHTKIELFELIGLSPAPRLSHG